MRDASSALALQQRRTLDLLTMLANTHSRTTKISWQDRKRRADKTSGTT
jgi:predicted site-specific integrase-resolvase